MSIDNKVDFADKFLVPISNVILGFGIGALHGYLEQQAGMYLYEDPNNAALFAAPLVVGVIEPVALMVTGDRPNMYALCISLVGMYPAIIIGKNIGRAIGAVYKR